MFSNSKKLQIKNIFFLPENCKAEYLKSEYVFLLLKILHFVLRLRRDLGRPLLMLGCRHHIWELHLKHFWEAVACEKTAGPNNLLFKGLKDIWLLFEANSEETELVRFDWKSIRGTWLENQARDAKNYLQMVVKTGSFRNLKVIYNEI